MTRFNLTAPQVVLVAGTFEPGNYEAKWYRDWKRVGETP